MHRDLERLCDLQIESIKHDIDFSINKVTKSTGKSLELCETLLDRKALPDTDRNILLDLKDQISGIIVGMQFHDELVQRITHLQEILSMIESVPTGKDEMTEESRHKVYSKLHTIMTIRSEYEQLKKIFPNYVTDEGNNNCIELF